MTKLFFKGADAAIIVYDIGDKKTFERAKKWVDELHQANDLRGDGDDDRQGTYNTELND